VEATAVLADKAYDADERVREPLAKRGIQAVIPSKKNCLVPHPYDKHLYKARHLIENFFAQLKQFRAIATRYDKRAINFIGAIFLVSSVILLS
jgi:transposase